MIFLFQCLECEGLFCPQKFVCHSHNPKNRTCHWGFDSDNWRSYLHLAEDYTDSEMEKLSKIVTDFKNRYKPTSTSTAITSKRKTVRHKNQLNFLGCITLCTASSEIVNQNIQIMDKNLHYAMSRNAFVYVTCEKN